MISVSGLGGQIALRVVDATRDRQMELLRSDAQNQRGEEAFRERIGGITTPEELIADFEVYSFVMRAFDLEDQIFGKGMIRKILESDPEEPSSLLNRLTDIRFREMHLALGFTTTEGPQTPDFTTEEFAEDIVNRFYNRQFISGYEAENVAVGRVLEFRDAAEDLENWFQVLRNPELTQFFQIALGLPSALSGLDVEVQQRRMSEKFDLETLSDPAVREDLVSRFIALSEVQNPQQALASSAALNILSSASFGAQFVPIALNVPSVTFSAASLYR
ncbi:DUF1217 domain-containing protein [uncultured Sulfitobacter sp.]|uniref:DUF1217 domain-containing protein n=1 Tax=uncultured Sulfitobacter sp. TaxID=191468 RepID=UPI00261499A3|nr:DUF1217 domain-containing protein [uncultured Sulfitobacter sp.]